MCYEHDRYFFPYSLVFNNTNTFVSGPSGTDPAHRFCGQLWLGVTFHQRACRHED